MESIKFNENNLLLPLDSKVDSMPTSTLFKQKIAKSTHMCSDFCQNVCCRDFVASVSNVVVFFFYSFIILPMAIYNISYLISMRFIHFVVSMQLTSDDNDGTQSTPLDLMKIAIIILRLLLVGKLIKLYILYTHTHTSRIPKIPCTNAFTPVPPTTISPY